MIYTARIHLTVLQLNEKKDFVTFAELLPVLRERLSHVVYIEVHGVLHGIVTKKHICQASQENRDFVAINKSPKFVRCGEYIQAKRFFIGRTEMLYLPVVDENGRLCGEYKKDDELTHLECFMPRYINLPALKERRKERFRPYSLVQPNSCSIRKKKLFQKMKSLLELYGIEFTVIERQGLFSLDAPADLLFADLSEMAGYISVCSMIKHSDMPYMSVYRDWCYKEMGGESINLSAKFVASSALKQIEAMGVHILPIYFAENENGFYKKICDELYNRNTRLGIVGYGLPQSLKKNFFGEIYNEEYEKAQFPLPVTIQYFEKDKVPMIKDADEPLLHIQHGDRVTTGQPAQCERCIYLYGPCLIFGSYVEDQHTIASCLQDNINRAGIRCKAINKGQNCSPEDELKKINQTPLKKGDIIIIHMKSWSFRQLRGLNLTNVLEQNPISLDWFTDEVLHCNHKANKLFADAIFKELYPILTEPVIDRTPVEAIDLNVYISAFFSDFNPSTHGVIGSVVMNCNPFTLGHRWLIEKALERVDFLIIFVVEEDQSIFTFEERLAMVYSGVSDLDNVRVVPSGENILSQKTFPEYFIKVEDENLVKNVENDITIFAEQIAPRLNISCRFVGEETEDSVTDSYNTAMKKILPAYGIDIIEIPRKEADGSIISASRVRRCLETDDQITLAKLVPPSTMQIMYSEDE